MRKLTTNEFIEKAKLVHGDKYDYSKTEYINSKTKITIICKIHGEFLQTCSNHLKRKGCKKCASKKLSLDRKSNTKKFIERAKKVHGDKYDYSRFIYINSHTKGIIICPIHNEFFQNSNSHLNGSDCVKCYYNRLKKELTNTTEIFIEKAKLVHGNTYDYSKVNYINSATNVIIICSEHGDFLLTPNHHIQGRGCKKCAISMRSENQKLTLNEFIEKSNKIHNNKYNYSKFIYINAKSDGIICPKHGIFEQNPNKHLRTKGCYKCGRIISGNKFRSTTEKFIEKSRLIHGEKYDYSKVNYINTNTEVEIICSKHGIFKQKANNHMHGKGCKKCILESTISKGELEWLEYMGLKEDDCQINIGKYWVDALKDGIIYEFLGDYYHGNSEIYDPYDFCKSKEMFFMRYMKTFYRFDKLKMCGYKIKYIWELNWNNFKKGIDKEPKILEY